MGINLAKIIKYSFLTTIWLGLLVFANQADAAIIRKAPNNLNLVVYYRMDEGVNTKVGDFSGNGYTANFAGGAANPTWTNGKYGKGLDFSPTGSTRLNLGSVSALNATNLTMCAWIYPRSAPNYPNIFSNISGTDGFDFYLNDANNLATSFGTGSYVYGPGIQLNTWQHVCAVHNGNVYSNMSVYINGVNVTSVYSAGPDKTPGSGTSYIGNDPSSTYDFDGVIDDFRFYNRVLTPTEIYNLYKSGAANVKKQAGFVQKATGFNNTGASVGSIATSAFTETAGNFLAVFVKHEQGATSITLSDTLGNTYYPLTYVSHSNLDLNSQWFYAKNIKGGSNTITATFGATRPYVKIGALEYSGIDIASPFDSQISAEGGSGTLMTTANVATQGPFLALEGAGEYNTQTYTSASPWTERWDCRQEDGNCSGTSIAEYIGNGRQRISGAMTQNASAAWLMNVAVFKLKYQMLNSSQNNRLTDGLVGLWTFNGQDYNAASTTAEVLDRSGQGNNGDAVNGPARTIGKVGQALSFDGVDDYVNLGRLSYTESASQLTWSFWTYVNTIQDGDAFISKEDVYNTGSWHIGILTSCNVGNQLGVFIATTDGDGGTLGCADSVTAGVWTHYTVVYDGTKTGNANRLKIYVNGVQDSVLDFIGTIPASTIVSANNVRIGDNPVGTARLNGKIDEVRIYNRALTDSEVKQLYNMGR